MFNTTDKYALLLMQFLDAYHNGAAEWEMEDLVERTEKILKDDGWAGEHENAKP